jgi:hypothetical protein
MKSFTIGGGLWLLLAVSWALGSPVISVGTHYMLNTDMERRIPILVSSATQEHVEGLNFAVQIGDGGPVNGGVNTSPRITNLDIIGPGTIFNASNTGATPLYVGSGGDPPYLIALAETTTVPVEDVEANGVLAWLTVNPQNAALGSYPVSLQNVGQNVENGNWTTNFGGTPASFSGSSSIAIIDLHEMKWNAGQNGGWTDATWTGSPPPYPNYTAQAKVDTPYTVNVESVEEAHSLDLSNNGMLSITSAGSLALTTNATIANGSDLQVEGALTAQNIAVDGTLTLTVSGTADVANISGSGDVMIGGATTLLTADSISVNTLSISGGSKIIINPLLGGPLTGSASLAPVPEPSTITLLILAGFVQVIGFISARYRRGK